MAWYEEASTWVTGIGLAVSGAVGWLLKSWKSYSSTSVQVQQDDVQGSWYKDLLARIKDAETRADAAEASAKHLLKDKIEDARLIARQEVTIESLRDRATHCEFSAAESKARVVEIEERNRAMSEQLLYTHIRGRKMFIEISRLDPLTAARIVKENFDDNIQDVAATIKAQDEMTVASNESTSELVDEYDSKTGTPGKGK